MSLLAATTDAATATGAPNVWTFLTAMTGAVLSVGTLVVTYLVKKDSKATKQSTEDLVERTKTNRNSNGNMGLSLDQVHDGIAELKVTVDAIAGHQQEASGLLVRVVKDARETKLRVARLETAAIPRPDFGALGDELES